MILNWLKNFGGSFEYKCRLRDREPHEHPDLYAQRMMDARCKIAVLEELLKSGRVVTWDLALALGKEFNKPGISISVALAFARAFINACGVVADYCKTGGAHAHGGTGLK